MDDVLNTLRLDDAGLDGTEAMLLRGAKAADGGPEAAEAAPAQLRLSDLSGKQLRALITSLGGEEQLPSTGWQPVEKGELLGIAAAVVAQAPIMLIDEALTKLGVSLAGIGSGAAAVSYLGEGGSALPDNVALGGTGGAARNVRLEELSEEQRTPAPPPQRALPSARAARAHRSASSQSAAWWWRWAAARRMARTWTPTPSSSCGSRGWR